MEGMSSTGAVGVGGALERVRVRDKGEFGGWRPAVAVSVRSNRKTRGGCREGEEANRAGPGWGVRALAAGRGTRGHRANLRRTETVMSAVRRGLQDCAYPSCES